MLNKTQTFAGYVVVAGLPHTVKVDKMQHQTIAVDAVAKVAQVDRD